MEFGRLKEIRMYADLTQQDIADILHVKRGTYAAWECGNDIIPIRKVYDLAIFYELSIDYLLGLVDKKEKVTGKKKIDLTIVGSNLFYIRKKMGLGQLNFAKSIGINQSTLWAYEKGITLITTTSLMNLAKIYNVSIDKIFGRTSNQNYLIFMD